MKTSLIIGMTNTNGDDKQKSITDVSNTATNEELVAFGQGLVAVTNNTYKNTTKVTKVDCDNESKTARSITVKFGDEVYTPGTVYRKALSTVGEYSNTIAGYAVTNTINFSSKEIVWQSVAYIQNIVTTAGETTAKIGSRTTYGAQTHINCSCALNAKETCTYHYDVVVPETDTYQEWRQTIYVEVYDDSENP